MVDVLRRNHVVQRGHGDRVLVFGNGFGCDQRVWQLVAPRFEDRYGVVLFDYVGMGRSDRAAFEAARYATLDGYARDLVEVCEALDLSDIVYVGHSVGAMIGVLAAVASPRRFAKLVLLGPSPRYLNDPPAYVGGFERGDIEGLLGLMDQNFVGWASTLAQMVLPSAELAAELRDTFCSNDPSVMRAFAHVTFLSDHRDTLPMVEQPCLVLQCARDGIAPVAVGEYVRDRLPRARYRLFDAPGHMPQVSHPDLVAGAIRDFLEAGE